MTLPLAFAACVLVAADAQTVTVGSVSLKVDGVTSTNARRNGNLLEPVTIEGPGFKLQLEPGPIVWFSNGTLVGTLAAETSLKLGDREYPLAAHQRVELELLPSARVAGAMLARPTAIEHRDLGPAVAKGYVTFRDAGPEHFTYAEPATLGSGPIKLSVPAGAFARRWNAHTELGSKEPLSATVRGMTLQPKTALVRAGPQVFTLFTSETISAGGKQYAVSEVVDFNGFVTVKTRDGELALDDKGGLKRRR